MPATIKENIKEALGNLRDEAYFPLMQFAKKYLKEDIEAHTRDSIIAWAKKVIFLNKDFALSNYILSSASSAIKYIQDSISKANPNKAKLFFNFIKDKYAKTIVDNYLGKTENHEKFINLTEKFAKELMVQKIFRKIEKSKIDLAPIQSNGLKTSLTNLINDIEDTNKTVTNLTHLKQTLNILPIEVQKIVVDRLLQKKSIKEDSLTRFMFSSPETLVQDFQSKITNYGLRIVKSTQAKEIYQYDGLIERYLPASVRGLYDVDRDVVESIALNGDRSKEKDIFNFELASRARANPTYDVGHTGASNRSSTALSNIAMYFASRHGLRQGKPDSIWIMIYEPIKGINTTELVNKKVKWTEFEFATPELKSERCLGAVKFEVDEAKSTADKIAFKAVDGFVLPKVHAGQYQKAGIEGDIKHFLDIAKHFDKPQTDNVPKLDFILPKKDKEIAKKRTLFQRLFDKLGLSSNRDEYMKERERQLDFVRSETIEEHRKRLQSEKEMMSYWQIAANRLDSLANYAKSWLPGAAVKKVDHYIQRIAHNPDALANHIKKKMNNPL